MSLHDVYHLADVQQRLKKVVYDSPGLVDFAVRLVNSVHNFPNGQVKFLGEFKLQKSSNQSCWSVFLGGLHI